MTSKPNITVSITADAKGVKGGTDEALGIFDSFSKKTSGFMVGVGAKVTEFGIGTAQSLLAQVGPMIGLGKEAELFGKKADTVFGGSSKDIKAWADQVNESFGLSDEAVVGMAGSMGDLLKPMGFTESATSDLTKKMLDQAGALSAWSGGKKSAAEVADIMTDALLGETDGLKGLGIAISAADVEAKALAMTGKKSAGELTAQEKALATQALIMEKSTDATKAWSDGTMASVKKNNAMSASFADAKTAIGSGLLPIIQGLTSFFVDTVIPTVKDVVATFQEHWPAIKETVMNVVQPIIDWFRENWPKIQETVQQSIDFVTSIISVGVAIIRGIWEHFGTAIWSFIKGKFDAIMTIVQGAIDIIRGIIKTVTALIHGDWGAAWDGIKQIVFGIWTAIKGIVEDAINTVKFVLEAAWIAIKLVVTTAWDVIKGVVSAAIDGIVGFVTGIPGRIGAVIGGLWDGIKTGITDAKDWIGYRIDDVVAFATGLPRRLLGAFAGMWDGIKDAFKAAVNWIIDKWNGLEFKFPEISAFGVSVGGFTIGMPDIPRFHSGGIVPGRLGQEMFALLKAGERVVPVNQVALGGAGGGTTIYNLPPGIDPADLVKAQRLAERRGLEAA